jgi:hypothetical protein
MSDARTTAADVLAMIGSLGESGANFVPVGPGRIAVSVLGGLASIAAALLRAGHDPVITIRRVIAADAMLADVHAKWESEIAGKP